MAAWLVYLTIGNLNCEICQKQTRLSNLLIGFIPIVPSDCHKNIKAKIWHQALSIMLERMYMIEKKQLLYVNIVLALKSISKTGIIIEYADSQNR